MAEPARVIEFKLPKRRPKVIEKQAPPDQRHYVVMPIKALTDKRLTDNQVRVLGVLCSYCNRAGITWVSQARIGKDLGVSQQAVAKQLKGLREHGYIEITSRGFRGERANTIRVIHDQTISQADAIAITSGQEDTRPPEVRRREEKAMEEEFTEEQMAANRQRLRELLSGLKPKNHTTHQPVQIGAILMPKRAPRAPKKTPNIDNTEVVHETPIIDNIIDNTGVVQTQKNIGLDKVLSIYEKISKHRFSNVRSTIDEVDMRCAAIMCEVGVSEARFIDACQTMPIHLRLSEVCEQLAGEVTGF